MVVREAPSNPYIGTSKRLKARLNTATKITIFVLSKGLPIAISVEEKTFEQIRNITPNDKICKDSTAGRGRYI